MTAGLAKQTTYLAHLDAAPSKQ